MNLWLSPHLFTPLYSTSNLLLLHLLPIDGSSPFLSVQRNIFLQTLSQQWAFTHTHIYSPLLRWPAAIVVKATKKLWWWKTSWTCWEPILCFMPVEIYGSGTSGLSDSSRRKGGKLILCLPCRWFLETLSSPVSKLNEYEYPSLMSHAFSFIKIVKHL